MAAKNNLVVLDFKKESVAKKQKDALKRFCEARLSIAEDDATNISGFLILTWDDQGTPLVSYSMGDNSMMVRMLPEFAKLCVQEAIMP